jgi:hypothetical protein
MARLQSALQAAAMATALERCRTLPDVRAVTSGRQAIRAVTRRSLDPSQVRHEWGLAGNALFIAAPRAATRRLHLAGQAFLHEYNPDEDTDGAALESILTAPLVVAHWINAQYLFSTLDAAMYGAGSKTAHNPVGGIGVLTGPTGDLRLGLTEQSVHYRHTPAHPAVRLLAVIAADPSRIDAVLRRHGDLTALVDGAWIHLAALHPVNGRLLFRDATGWHPAPTAPRPPADAHALSTVG